MADTDTRLTGEQRDKLLAAISAATAGTLDMAEAVRNDDPGMADNDTGETLTNLVDAARLAMEAADRPDRDGQLIGAIMKWLAENGDGLRGDLEPHFQTMSEYVERDHA